MVFGVGPIAASGCAVNEALRSDPGIDISAVRPGATRAQVEAAVGAAWREWTTALGVRYCLYRYHGGTQSDPVTVTGVVLLEIATLGLLEVITRAVPADGKGVQGKSRYPMMAVAYDGNDVAIGVFQDIDPLAALPADGRAQPVQPPAERPSAPAR